MPHNYKWADAEHTIVQRDDGRSFVWPKGANVANINGRVAEDYRREGSPKPAPYKTPEPVAAAKPKQQAKPQQMPDAFDASSLQNLMSPLADAQAAIRSLEGQRDALNKRRAEHDAERERIAYAARVQGDKEASARLGEMTAEAIRRDHELADIGAALKTAREHFQRAQEEEARHAERGRAREILAVVERLRMAGQAADDALAVLVAAGAAIHEATDQLHRLGNQSPTGQQILSFGERAIRSAIQRTIWLRCIERLGPNERCSFVGVISQWAATIERQLGEQKEEEAA
jgi:hypothetical protein